MKTSAKFHALRHMIPTHDNNPNPQTKKVPFHQYCIHTEDTLHYTYNPYIYYILKPYKNKKESEVPFFPTA
jgi:hypothetical protein